MKLDRRSFLKGIFAVGTTALLKGPQILDDLTPQERDIAADVMGLRHKYWSGVDWAQSEQEKTVIIPIFEGRYWPDGRPAFGELHVPAGLSQETIDALATSLPKYPKRSYEEILTCKWLPPSEKTLKSLGRMLLGEFDAEAAERGLTDDAQIVAVRKVLEYDYIGRWESDA